MTTTEQKLDNLLKEAAAHWLQLSPIQKKLRITMAKKAGYFNSGDFTKEAGLGNWFNSKVDGYLENRGKAIGRGAFAGGKEKATGFLKGVKGGIGQSFSNTFGGGMQGLMSKLGPYLPMLLSVLGPGVIGGLFGGRKGLMAGMTLGGAVYGGAKLYNKYRANQPNNKYRVTRPTQSPRVARVNGVSNATRSIGSGLRGVTKNVLTTNPANMPFKTLGTAKELYNTGKGFYGLGKSMVPQVPTQPIN